MNEGSTSFSTADKGFLTRHIKTFSELISGLQVDDSSIHAIAEEIKQHPMKHAAWLCHHRMAEEKLLQAENDYSQLVGRKVTLFQRTASSAASVSNYAKYEVILDVDVRMAQQRVDHYRMWKGFTEDVSRLYSRRGEMLMALLKIDHEAIVNDARTSQAMYMAAQNVRKTFNNLIESSGTVRWTQEKI